jgi:hypothetical protein
MTGSDRTSGAGAGSRRGRAGRGVAELVHTSRPVLLSSFAGTVDGGNGEGVNGLFQAFHGH